MRRWTSEARTHIALTLPLGPVVVFQLIAATFRQMTLTDGKVFAAVRAGTRRSVLSGGEKWNLGPNDTLPWAEPPRRTFKCWSIQSAGKQEISWMCLCRCTQYCTTVSRRRGGAGGYMMRRRHLSFIMVNRLVFDFITEEFRIVCAGCDGSKP